MDKREFCVMVVEDNPDDYEIFKEIAGESGLVFGHTWAQDGEEALDWLKNPANKIPSVVLLDLNMPKVDGWEFLEVIRKDERLKYLPIVVFTSSRNPADAIRAYRAGANTFVTKPLSCAEFTKFLKTFYAYWFETSMLPVFS